MPPPVKPPRQGPAADARPTPAQLRAARGLLGWSQDDLARAAAVSLRTVNAIELSPDLLPAPGRASTLARLVEAFRAAGVGFTRAGDAVGVTRAVPGGTRAARRGEAEER